MLALVDTNRPPDARAVEISAGRLERLAMRAQGGDREAVRELLAAIAPTLLGVARAILGAGAPDVEDVAQESLLAFFHALPAFRAESSVRHYASRIAARIAIAARRRARERQARVGGEDETAPLSGVSGLVGSLDADALAGRRRELLRSLLAELPEAQAESIALRVVMGYSMEEVAEATGAPVNTVRSRLRLAKEALRKRIEADAGLMELLEDRS
jgi:RNA polymerase sigma-70 factor (ECF subfamily)